jgi:hypothetical protein
VYRLKCREGPESLWQDAGVALTTECSLSGQERGKEWEYRVVAMNRAGEGVASNAATVVS